MSKGQERRKYKRIEKQYMTRFRIRSDEVHEMESDDWDSVILKNVSKGGALFFYNKDLGLDTLLDLKIYLPKAILIINCVGKIIRSHKPQLESMFTIAVKFIDIGDREKELTNKAVEGISEQENQGKAMITNPDG
jgi:hypothetical protein